MCLAPFRPSWPVIFAALLAPFASAQPVWEGIDLGAAPTPGASSISTPGEVHTLEATALGWAGTGPDAFHYQSITVEGDFSFRARRLIAATQPEAQAGLMVRSGLGASDPFVFLGHTPQDTLLLQARLAAGGSLETLPASGVTPPIWFRVDYQAGRFDTYISENGADWRYLASPRLEVAPATWFAGFAGASPLSPNPSYASFDNVNIDTAPERTGLWAEFFPNNFTPIAPAHRVEATVDYDASRSVAVFVPHALRWSGRLIAPAAGVYTLHLDSPAKVWLNGALVLTASASSPATAEVTLNPATPASLVVEATAHPHHELKWSSADLPLQLISPDHLRPLDPSLDTDTDGLPDYWEIRHGLNPFTAADIASDTDGDHFTALQEYTAGTSPITSDTDGDGLTDGRNARGLLLLEQWKPDLPGNSVRDFRRTNLWAVSPTGTAFVDSPEIPAAYRSKYSATRLRGYVEAPLTGNYQFFVTGEYTVELYLGSDHRSTTKRLVATVNGWIEQNAWMKNPAQRSGLVSLQAGQRYYVEIINKSEGPGARAQLGWTTPDNSTPRLVESASLIAFGAEDDLDDDLLPDSWEITYFGDLTASPEADFDADGVSNLQEAQAGLNPLDAHTDGPSANDAATLPGHLTLEYWLGTATATGDFLATTLPPYARLLHASAQEPSTLTKNYVGRLSGYITAPVSGVYKFRSYDGSGGIAFYLSTDDNPVNQQRLYNQTKTAVSRTLQAGQRYAFTGLRNASGTGPYRLDLQWQKPGSTTYEIIPAAHLSARDLPAVIAPSLTGEWTSAQIRRNRGWFALPSAATQASDGTLTLSAGGTGIRPRVQADDAQLVYKTLPGEGALSVRFASFAAGSASAQFGLTLRQSLDVGAPHVSLRTSHGKSVQMLWRGAPDLPNSASPASVRDGALWLRLVRSQGIVYAYTSIDGELWQWHSEIPFPAEGPLYAGTFVASGADDQLATATADSLRLDFDSDGDGLYDSQEVPGGSLTLDTDGDGYTDYEELHYLHSDPTVADLQPAQLAGQLAGSAGQPASGQWAVSDGEIYNLSVRGAVTYTFNLAEAGVHRLAVTARPRANATADTRWDVLASLDGQSLGRLRYVLQLGETGTARIYTPWLSAGTHTVTLFLDNVSLHRTFAFQQVTLERIPGADLDGDGIADWQPARLSAQNALLNAAFASRTSPFCLEGRAAYLNALALTADGQPLAALPAVADAWYADVPLSPDGPVALEAHFENGGKTLAQTLTWTPTNLLGGGSLTLRRGDSLLLQATPTGATTGAALVEIRQGATVLDTIAIPAGQSVPHAFPTAGTYTLAASYQGEDPAVVPVTGTFTVTVLAATFTTPDPVVALGYYREWLNPDLPVAAAIEVDGRMEVAELTPPATGGRKFRLRVDAPETRRIAARLPADGSTPGAILDVARIDGVRIASGTQTGIYFVDQFEDGTVLVEMRVVLSSIPPDLRVKFEIFVAGVTFEDGTTVKWFTAADFDATGQLKVRFLRAPGVNTSVCHRLHLYQGETLLETRTN